MRLISALTLAALAAPASSAEVVRQVGRVVMRVETRYAFPGGALLVRASSAGRLGGVNVVFDGRRVPLLPAGGLLRALVPVPLETQMGTHTLGFEVAPHGARRQRVPVDVEIVPRSYAARAIVLPALKLGVVASHDARRDARQLLVALRSGDLARVPGGWLLPPVPGTAGLGFGASQQLVGLSAPVQPVLDGAFGEQHRGVDYDAPVGAPVYSPGPARVALARWLAGTGWTLVLDHGAGLVSTLWHLSELAVQVEQELEAGTVVGRSGDSGLASHPHVHWGVYLHGQPIDPDIAMRGFGE